MHINMYQVLKISEMEFAGVEVLMCLTTRIDALQTYDQSHLDQLDAIAQTLIPQV